jgi:hypothetical protein
MDGKKDRVEWKMTGLRRDLFAARARMLRSVY